MHTKRATNVIPVIIKNSYAELLTFGQFEVWRLLWVIKNQFMYGTVRYAELRNGILNCSSMALAYCSNNVTSSPRSR